MSQLCGSFTLWEKKKKKPEVKVGHTCPWTVTRVRLRDEAKM